MPTSASGRRHDKSAELYQRFDRRTIYLTMGMVAVVGLACVVATFSVWSGRRAPSTELLTTLAQVDVGVLIAIAVDGGRSRWTRRGVTGAAGSLGLAIFGLIKNYDFAATAAVALLFWAVVSLIALVLRHYVDAPPGAATEPQRTVASMSTER